MSEGVQNPSCFVGRRRVKKLVRQDAGTAVEYFGSRTEDGWFEGVTFDKHVKLDGLMTATREDGVA